MYHCCQFTADEVYSLEDTDLCTSRRLSIGFCPQCGKPVAELEEYNFAGGINRVTAAGLNAQQLVQTLKNEIVCSLKKTYFKKSKTKPYGWRYGINKEYKNGQTRQYACDFYGNKELIKKM